jgi:hypothetical protein
MTRQHKKPLSAPATATQAPAEKWEVFFHDEFLPEFRAFDLDVRRELAAAARAIELAGPKTGRPHVDTLNGSKHDNMKELRFKALIKTADKRFDAHLKQLAKAKKESS